jgi:hypothetical protein
MEEKTVSNLGRGGGDGLGLRRALAHNRTMPSARRCPLAPAPRRALSDRDLQVRIAPVGEAPIEGKIVARHDLGCEAPLEGAAASAWLRLPLSQRSNNSSKRMIPILVSLSTRPTPVPASLERFQNRTDHALPKPANSRAPYTLSATPCGKLPPEENLIGRGVGSGARSDPRGCQRTACSVPRDQVLATCMTNYTRTDQQHSTRNP